ncbi:hypothetical protein RZS08_66545, partial [Arthrospira platensis SPKY1]|nr:hypothetical protein [Arthrospira platensis SPKY1]
QQFGKLLQNPKHDAAQSMLLQSIIIGNKHTPRIISAVVELLVLHGLRISEVLRIKGEDISERGYIKIKGSKGSYDRIVYGPVHKDFWLSMRNTRDSIGSVFS